MNIGDADVDDGKECMDKNDEMTLLWLIMMLINRYIKAVSYLGKESSQEVKLLSPPLELGTTEVVAVFVGS